MTRFIGRKESGLSSWFGERLPWGRGSGRQLVLDIGAGKVAVLIGELDVDRSFRILGSGFVAYNNGRGEVDARCVGEVVQQAVREAKKSASMDPREKLKAIAAISDPSIRGESLCSGHSVKGGIVTPSHMRRAREVATAHIPGCPPAVLLHKLENGYFVNRGELVRDPTGLPASLLEARVHVVTIGQGAVGKARSFLRAGSLRSPELVFSPLAAAKSALSAEQQEAGVALVDIGKRTSDVVVYNQGMIRATGVTPIGGDHVTQELAHVLKTDFEVAEALKVESGGLDIGVDNSPLEVPLRPRAGAGAGASRLRRHPLITEIQRAYRQIFADLARFLCDRLETDNLARALGAGVVLTGGGSLPEGVERFASEVLKVDVSVGYPRLAEGLALSLNDPRLTVAIGLFPFQLEREYSGRPPYLPPPSDHWTHPGR